MIYLKKSIKESLLAIIQYLRNFPQRFSLEQSITVIVDGRINAGVLEVKTVTLTYSLFGNLKKVSDVSSWT